MKTAKIIEEVKEASDNSPKDSPKESGREKRLKNLVAPWPKGVSGNPGGKPKVDIAAEIARAVFSENREAIYKAMSKSLLKGNAYSFDVVACRGFGKLKETKEVTHFYQDVPDTDLEKRISELLTDLGLAAQVDAAGGVEGPKAGAGKTNGHAKDSDLLPR